jgi:hypothetical protein
VEGELVVTLDVEAIYKSREQTWVEPAVHLEVETILPLTELAEVAA